MQITLNFKSFYLFIIAGLITLFTTTSCSGVDKNAPLPERNAEVKEYFDALDTLVNEYCLMVEHAVEGTMALENKDEETTFMDGLNILTDMVTSATKIAKLAEEVEAMQEQHPEFEENLSADDFAEFMEIFKNTMKRFYDLGKKMEAHNNSLES